MFDTSMQPVFPDYAAERSRQTITAENIYRLTLPARSQAAVHEWQRAMNMVYEYAGYGTALTLTDARRSVLPPLAYVTLLSDLWTGHLHRRLHSRNALLCADPLPRGAELVLHALPGYGNNRIAFFQLKERDRAIRWLISDD